MKQNTKFAVMTAAVLFLGAMFMQNAGATPATAPVNTPQRTGELVSLAQGSNSLFAGTLVCITTDGVLAPASDVASLKVVGRAERSSDNTGDAYSAAKTVTVRRGVFQWANGGGFTNSDIGSLAYVQDDNTVTTAGASTYKIVAGIIVDVDANGVWVDSYAVGGQGAASVTTLAASGNASVGGTLGVTGATTLTGNTIVSGTLTATGAVTAVSTVKAAGFLVGTGTGWGGAVTNFGPGVTNYISYVGGIVTNVSKAQ